MSITIDVNRSGLQRLTCGCTVEIRYGSPLWDALCPAASDLFGALIKSPDANKRECAERDALRSHIGLESEPQCVYPLCACRDCMDITVSSDTSKPKVCDECFLAGCEAYRPGDANYEALPAHMRECQRDDAYGEA
jgi:hypothetical protein